jgi:PAS domain S-box-containing protein
MDMNRAQSAARQSHGQEWLEAILDSIGDAVIVTDEACRVTRLNPVAEQLTGWTLEQADGKRLDEVLVLRSGTTGDRVDCPAARALREAGRGEASAFPADAIAVRPDGTETPVDDSLALIREEHGRLLGAVIVFRDATARRREMQRLAFLADASVELNASLDFEKTLSTVAKLAVPALADFCKVVMVVDGVLRPLACTHVDAEKARLALTYFEPCVLHPMLGPAHVIRTGQPELLSEIGPEVIAAASERCRDWLRQLKPTSYIGVPLKRGQETIGAIAWVMADSGRHYDARDLSVAVALAERAAIAVENSRLFEQLSQARGEADARRAEAERANRAKDEFMAVLGHELRNPLAPIVTALELMKLRGADSHERSIMERQVKHMCRLVDDLLDVSRITSSKVTLAVEPVDIAHVVALGMDLVSPLLEQRRHAVTVGIEGGTRVEGDPTRLAQVVSNLLENAAKYSAPGSPICIDASREGGDVVLRVRDAGIGIESSELPYIFEPFVQQPQALDRARGGLGLGLAIVRGLVERHGGRVSARSDGRGSGSEFVVRLPALDGAFDVPPCPPVLTEHGGPVLVVDDNEDARELLVRVLQSFGHQAFAAPDGGKALALANAVRPTLALLDIGLPEMDGYELARRLRELDGLASLKVVAISGYGLDTDRARSASAGFDEHLVKPVTIEAIQSVLERFASEVSQGRPCAGASGVK